MKIKYGKSATFIVISSSNAQLASYLVRDEMEFHREMFNKSILYERLGNRDRRYQCLLINKIVLKYQCECLPVVKHERVTYPEQI